MFLAPAFLLAPGMIFGLDIDSLTWLVVLNDTPEEITHLYISPSAGAHWGPNSLGGRAVFQPGASKEFWVHHADSCRFDILAVSESGVRRFSDFDICSLNGSVLRLSAVEKTNTRQPEVVTVTFVNRTGYPLRYLFMAPRSAESFGASLAGEDSLIFPDVSISVDVSVADNSEVLFEVIAYDNDLDLYTFSIPVSLRRFSIRREISLDDIQW
jgi:hypothetical protein